jgi:formate/nitrite transporter
MVKGLLCKFPLNTNLARFSQISRTKNLTQWNTCVVEKGTNKFAPFKRVTLHQIAISPFHSSSSSSFSSPPPSSPPPSPSSSSSLYPSAPSSYYPDAIFNGLVSQSYQKRNRDSGSVFLSCVFGGVLLSFGCATFVMISGGSPNLQKENPGVHRLMGGLIFPIGLGMIMMTGAELVTSNFFLCALPILSPQSLVGTSGGQASVANAVRICAASLAGNAFGSVVVACACADTLFVSEQHSNWIAALAEMKCRLGPGVVFIKAIGANFLVNVAVLSAAGASTPGGKLAALWGPICAFVILGLEHSVANMFLVPLGIMRGAKVTPTEALTSNIIPAVIGNLIGALLLVQMKVPPNQYGIVMAKMFAK